MPCATEEDKADARRNNKVAQAESINPALNEIKEKFHNL